MNADLKREQQAGLPEQALSIIRKYQLTPHPEGGYFGDCKRPQSAGPREGEGTCIYYLMIAGRGTGSRLHRLRDQIEIWRYLEGDPVELLLIAPEGPARLHFLGGEGGQESAVTILEGFWQGARVKPGRLAATQGYSLITCTVTPGYDGNKFEMATAAQILELVEQFEDDAQINLALQKLMEDLLQDDVIIT